MSERTFTIGLGVAMAAAVVSAGAYIWIHRPKEDLPPAPEPAKEVFIVGVPDADPANVNVLGGFALATDDLDIVAQAFGAEVATQARVEEAQLAGAQWCNSYAFAYTNDLSSIIGAWPMAEATEEGQGCGSVGTNIATGGIEGNQVVTLYGVKPAEGTTKEVVLASGTYTVTPGAFFTPLDPVDTATRVYFMPPQPTQ